MMPPSKDGMLNSYQRQEDSINFGNYFIRPNCLLRNRHPQMSKRPIAPHMLYRRKRAVELAAMAGYELAEALALAVIADV
jgi:hypothetical protein